MCGLWIEILCLFVCIDSNERVLYLRVYVSARARSCVFVYVYMMKDEVGRG